MIDINSPNRNEDSFSTRIRSKIDECYKTTNSLNQINTIKPNTPKRILFYKCMFS